MFVRKWSYVSCGPGHCLHLVPEPNRSSTIPDHGYDVIHSPNSILAEGTSCGDSLLISSVKCADVYIHAVPGGSYRIRYIGAPFAIGYRAFYDFTNRHKRTRLENLPDAPIDVIL